MKRGKKQTMKEVEEGEEADHGRGRRGEEVDDGGGRRGESRRWKRKKGRKK